MNKHTPGPWLDTMDSHMVPQVVAGPITIAKVYLPPMGSAFSNARLMACAPEMLDALRRAVLALAFAAETSPAMRDDYKAVSDAIAKATGGSNE